MGLEGTTSITGRIWGADLGAVCGREGGDEDMGEDLGAIWEYFGASPGRLETP